MTGRTDVALEHQVELDRFAELVAGGRVNDLVLAYNVTELLASVVVDLSSEQQ
jgi:hypothetical protein